MSSQLAHIQDIPLEPVELFKKLLPASEEELQVMNLATLDEEFGVLNRTVVYRGLAADQFVTYVTQTYTRNCKNLRTNPKACLTFYLPPTKTETGVEEDTWQVRLLGARAEELPQPELDAWWKKEKLPAQIRAYVCPCGEPVDYEQLKIKHDDFLKQHLASGKPLERPATYTAFKFLPQRWDFLKVGPDQIADRVQYRLQPNGKWLSMHVAT